MIAKRVSLSASDILSYGTKENPVELTRTEYEELMSFVQPFDMKMRKLDFAEWDQCLSGVRELIKTKYPWWFPGVSIVLVEE